MASALPLELVHTILEAHYYTPDCEPDRSLLQSCSLVCNAWSNAAQRLLFTNVVLRSENHFHSLCNALRQPTLANAVRTLRIILDHKQPHGLRQHHLATVVGLCPRLESVSLSVFGNDSVGGNTGRDNDMSNDIVDAINSPRQRGAGGPSIQEAELSLSLSETLASSPITSFHLRNWSSNTLSLPSFLTSLPALKVLSIAGTPPSVPISVPSSCLNLSHLRVNFQHSPSVNFLRWLLENSRNTLTALDLERLSDSDASIGLLDQLTTTHGPFLRSLTLPSCATLAEFKHFQKCTNLRTVAFRTPSVSPTVFKHLSTNSTPLEELYMCVDKNAVLSPVIDFVKNKKSLKSLVVCLWEQDVRKKLRLWGSLKMACAIRGVQLKVVESLSEYKALIVRFYLSFPVIDSLN